MSIYLGSKKLESFKHGNSDINKIYLGSSEVYSQDTFDYDYVLSGDYDEVDILYTTDTHAAWLNSGRSQYDKNAPQLFIWDDLSTYKDKLETANIPTFSVDAGDFTVSGSESDSDVSNYNVTLNKFNGLGTKGYTKYIATTYGNHEWKFKTDGDLDVSKCISWISKLPNFTACNFMNSNGTFQSYNKPYRAIKIGTYKVGIIGVGYPSANGNYDSYDSTTGIRTLSSYKFLDSKASKSDQQSKIAYNSSLYVQVQKYVDLFVENNFDFIIVVTHMDNNRDEDYDSDTRFQSRAEFLLMNTHDIDVVIPGHRNYPTSILETTDLNGNYCYVAPEAGAGLNSFGRLGLDFKNRVIKYKLLTTKDDLENIGW